MMRKFILPVSIIILLVSCHKKQSGTSSNEDRNIISVNNNKTTYFEATMQKNGRTGCVVARDDGPPDYTLKSAIAVTARSSTEENDTTYLTTSDYSCTIHKTAKNASFKLCFYSSSPNFLVFSSSKLMRFSDV